MRRTLSLPGKSAKTQAELDQAELGDLLEDARFIGFIWRLLGDGKSALYHSTYSGSPHDTSFREGQRALGLMVLDECMRARPETMVLLAQEGVRRASAPQPQPQPTGDADD